MTSQSSEADVSGKPQEVTVNQTDLSHSSFSDPLP